MKKILLLLMLSIFVFVKASQKKDESHGYTMHPYVCCAKWGPWVTGPSACVSAYAAQAAPTSCGQYCFGGMAVGCCFAFAITSLAGYELYQAQQEVKAKKQT